MPGDDWQKFANVRAFLAYMYAHPGKKLLFMGSDIGDYIEWNHHSTVPWEVLQYPAMWVCRAAYRNSTGCTAKSPRFNEGGFRIYRL